MAKNHFCQNWQIYPDPRAGSPLNSFRWKASRLFNALPANIRNSTNCETSVFKKKVDSYLQTILDNPCVPNEDNSLDARISEMRWCTLRGGLDG